MDAENVILVKDNIQVYESDIQVLCDEYIESLPNSDMIYKTTCFTGLLQYLYNHCIKNLPIRITNTGKAGYTFVLL